jgi:hypothetical protein
VSDDDKENFRIFLREVTTLRFVLNSLLLLQRSDIDISIKDYEGYTAFDLYNSTVEGTKPDNAGRADLLTWGANR